MTRARMWFVRAAVVGAVLGLAACDAASNVAAPSATSARRDGATTTSDGVMQPMTVAADTTATCRSGYQIAYRSDGTPYCVEQQ